MLNIIVKQRQRQIEIHQDPCSIKRERGKDLCGDAKGATLPPGSLPALVISNFSPGSEHHSPGCASEAYTVKALASWLGQHPVFQTRL